MADQYANAAFDSPGSSPSLGVLQNVAGLLAIAYCARASSESPSTWLEAMSATTAIRRMLTTPTNAMHFFLKKYCFQSSGRGSFDLRPPLHQ
eukprot:3209479-Rhodomonas_salina.4